MTFSGPSAANARAIELRAQGQLSEAVAALREGIADFPGDVALHQNLAQLLYESGDVGAAVSEHRAALAIQDTVASRIALYELLQITGDQNEALEQQRAALRAQRVFSHVAPHEKRSVLCLCTPGDWQANIPVDFLFDLQTTSVHKLYLVDGDHARRDLVPKHDVIWNIIAESAEALPALALADAYIREHRKPALNSPARVITTSRLLLPITLKGSGARVETVVMADRARLQSGEVNLGFPLIARPAGSHAGHGLERIDAASACASYAQRNPSDQYFLSPFVDYSSADGYFRKYRIVFVDGVAYPVHEAISQNWMIHYYNAQMSDHAWMRDEEAAFLKDLRAVFDGPRSTALDTIAQHVALEYFGIDCTIDRDGNVLVFEADAAMLVHTSDPVDLYPYKHEYIPRIYRAVEAMIDRRKGADT